MLAAGGGQAQEAANPEVLVPPPLGRELRPQLCWRESNCPQDHRWPQIPEAVPHHHSALEQSRRQKPAAAGEGSGGDLFNGITGLKTARERTPHPTWNPQVPRAEVWGGSLAMGAGPLASRQTVAGGGEGRPSRGACGPVAILQAGWEERRLCAGGWWRRALPPRLPTHLGQRVWSDLPPSPPSPPSAPQLSFTTTRRLQEPVGAERTQPPGTQLPHVARRQGTAAGPVAGPAHVVTPSPPGPGVALPAGRLPAPPHAALPGSAARTCTRGWLSRAQASRPHNVRRMPAGCHVLPPSQSTGWGGKGGGGCGVCCNIPRLRAWLHLA